MKFDEIEKMLPNGFHDALLQNISIDYGNHKAVFELELCIGDTDSEDENSRELYREGRLIFHKLIFCIIESPDSGYPFYNSRYLRIDAGTADSLGVSPQIRLPDRIPENTFICWFFVQEWNAFIYVAAADADFIWL